MKKILVVVLALLLCFTTVACGGGDGDSENTKSAESKDVKITDCVEKYEVTAIEDSIIYWTVYFNNEYNNQSFDGMDFYDIIDACLKKDESNASDVVGYSIVAYDSNGTQRFAWGYPDGYEPIHEWDENGQRIEQEYQYSPNF